MQIEDNNNNGRKRQTDTLGNLAGAKFGAAGVALVKQQVCLHRHFLYWRFKNLKRELQIILISNISRRKCFELSIIRYLFYIIAWKYYERKWSNRWNNRSRCYHHIWSKQYHKPTSVSCQGTVEFVFSYIKHEILVQ